MAAPSATSPGGRWRDLLAGLFEEAFRRERRRRRQRQLVLAALFGCAVAGAVLLFGRGGGVGASRAAAGGAARMALTQRALPALGNDPVVAVAGSRLVVSDTGNTSVAHGRVTGVCAAASVSPAHLRVISVAHGNCGNPALFGERVMPVVYAPTMRNHPGWGVNALAMRIAVVDLSKPTGYRLGPVIVTYPDTSDTRAETIYGAGSLWVYAPMLNPRRRFGEVLRVSLATGRVVERWRLPQILRALIATDADGLWLAPSNESGYPVDAPPSARVALRSLYRVAAGARSPVRVFDAGPWGARWLVADGHSVWIDVGRANGRHALWRFDGRRATAALRGARARGGVRRCGDLGDQYATVVGSAGGIFCVSDPTAGTQLVQWLAPSGGRSRVVARLRTQSAYEFPDNAVLYRGAYYFVELGGGRPPSSERPMLYRIGRR